MDSRRDFLKKATLLGAGGSLAGMLPESIQRAMAIDPKLGSTVMDAEHVVILMQENRSFDHCYGRLRGVRGFNDPRAVTLPSGNPVWFQSNAEGETYAPFRLNIKDTKATWMSALPHSWSDQTKARNHGRHDGWLDAKHSGNKAYAKMPLTMGFYDRDDIPFYYSLADAFTVCDQNFCSSLTGTTPNRLHLWTGTIREKPSIESKACVYNSDVDYGVEATWTTFPERLEDHGVSWCVYQNELSLDTGLTEGSEPWLANFTDNPIEWFTQFHVGLAKQHIDHLPAAKATLEAQLQELEAKPQPWPANVRKSVEKKRKELAAVELGLKELTQAKFDALPQREKNLHNKAFTTNKNDPHYREMSSLAYKDGEVERVMEVPKGDVLHQFRADVRDGKLPMVSWIVAPETFSDHPGAPWYGAWYLSEVLDILTQNPEVWKKTVFILCYDENDGYFDHVPPFVPPYPDRPDTGKVSLGIDTSVEHVSAKQDGARPGPIGLGFRTPLVVASPWSRGGYVCSEVFDHTSVLMFLEKLVSHKTGRTIKETNISDWRRLVCGDLSSVFRPYNGEKIDLPAPVQWKAHAGSIHQAQFKPLPDGYKLLDAATLDKARSRPHAIAAMPRQEEGSRKSCPLPYEIAADARLSADRRSLQIRFEAGNKQFGDRAAGVPFHVYSPAKIRPAGKPDGPFAAGRTWAYAVKPGDAITDSWPLGDFEGGAYDLRAHGPNGFYREFKGGPGDPALEVALLRTASPSSRDVRLKLANHDENTTVTVEIEDASYGAAPISVTLKPGGKVEKTLSSAPGNGWHDWRVKIKEAPHFAQRFAGRIETGQEGVCDPLLSKATG